MSSLKLIYVGSDQCRQILAMADISGGFLPFRHGQICEVWRHHSAILGYGSATCRSVWQDFGSPTSAIDNTG